MIATFACLIQPASSLPTDTSALESSISALESSISALESEIRTLESSSVPWEYGVWVSIFLVAVGVAMELWIIRHEWRDDMEAWALADFWAVRSPGRPSRTKLRVEIGSVLLIWIGVMGEFGIGIKTDPPFGEGKIPQIWVNVEPRPRGPQGEYKLQAEQEAKAKAKKSAHSK